MIHDGRHRQAIATLAGTFIAVLAVPSAILTLLGAHFSMGLTTGLVAGATIISLGVNWSRLRVPHLPVDDILPIAIDRRPKRRLHCPCELSMVTQVGQIARRFYGSSTIDVERYEQLRLKNPFILVCLTAGDGLLNGYFDIIPLRPAFGEMFLRGRTTERDITHEDVLGVDELGTCSHLYLSGLAVANPETHGGKESASILVWGMLRYIQYFYESVQPIAFASAVTREGEDLLQRFGLSLASSASERVDRHSMYSIALTRDVIARRTECIPDYSHLCQIDWEPANSIPGHRWRASSRRGRTPSSKLRQLSTLGSRATNTS
jgi:hypothetical protein